MLDPCYFDDDIIGNHYQCKVRGLSALDSHKKYTSNIFNVNAHQANIAMDNATITAIQRNRLDSVQLKFLIEDIKKLVPVDMPLEDSEAVSDSLEVIEHQLSQSSAKKGIHPNSYFWPSCS